MKVRVFVSYSHRDKKYIGENSLLGFLYGLQNEGVEFWYDRRIKAGELWDKEIRKEISQADIALILVSQHLLNSVYCMNVEVQQFLKRREKEGLRIFPIILSACDWESYEWLKRTQFLPGGGKNIARHYRSRGVRDELFLQILRQLRTLAKEALALRRARIRSKPAAKRERKQRSELPGGRKSRAVDNRAKSQPPKKTGHAGPEVAESWEQVRRFFAGYERVRVLESGRSTVFLAQKGDDRKVIKIMPHDYVDRTAPNLVELHPCIVDDEKYVEHDGKSFVLRPYVEGASLLEIIDRNPRLGIRGGLLACWAQDIMKLLLKLQKLKAPVIHRDISPANIVISTHNLVPHLIDFKAAVTLSRRKASSMGTPHFVAPEQLDGRPVLSSDLFSLGMLLLYLQTRILPPSATDMVTNRHSSMFQEWLQQHRIAIADAPYPLYAWLPRLTPLDARKRFRNAEQAFKSERRKLRTHRIRSCGRLRITDKIWIDMDTLRWKCNNKLLQEQYYSDRP